MPNTKKSRRFLSLACVLCLILSICSGGMLALASDGEAPEPEETVSPLPEPAEAVSPLPEASPAESPEPSPIAENPDPSSQPEVTQVPVPSDAAENPDPSEPPSTDAPSAAVSANLADFLQSVTINAPQDDSGAYIVSPYSDYDLTLSFAETESLQLDDTAVLTYSLPAGLLVSDAGPTNFSIDMVDENGSATVSGNTFEISGGRLLVRLNQADPNFPRLAATSNVRFRVALSSRLDPSATQIAFNSTISKSFVYETPADLTITKRVTYDASTDTASYVLQITSAGTNDNVVIEDSLTGTALIFRRDVTLESSLTGPISAAPEYTDSGFRVTLPQLSDGEIVTLRYTAAVDNTKISANGTVQQTGNTARVTSDQLPDGKTASADFAGQVRFDRITKTAVGEPVLQADGTYLQTWRITVNRDHKIPMGGTYIHDWITQNSRPFMTFSGDGVTIVVTPESGPSEIRQLSWSDLYLYTNESGTYGFRYLVPESDGNAAYEITCQTVIDSSAALNTLTVSNGAQVYDSYSEAQVTVGTSGVFSIEKHALGTTSTTSEWEITLTVPASGLPDLRVTDDLPRLIYEDNTYIDYYVADSMTVENLQPGESWRMSFNDETRTFVLTFYQDEAQSIPGVLPDPDGQTRTITLRYQTAVNQDWLNLAAEDGYATSTLYTHRNTASVRSGDYRPPSVSDVVYPAKPTLEKTYLSQSEAEIDGTSYPMFHYVLALSGPTADSAVIHDTFDTQYLRLYAEDGVRVTGGQTAEADEASADAAGTDTATGADLTVTSFPKLPDGTFYPFYRVEYSLIVKDAAALAQLRAAAAESSEGLTLENTAAWSDLTSSASAPYTYFPYVDKTLLTRPTADNGYVAEFKIFINQNAEDLDPTSDTLTIQDVLSSNLRFLPDSLEISPAGSAFTVQHDSETNTLTFSEVPDETAFQVTYQARVLGQGSVPYSNTVQFGKYEKTVTEEAQITTSGSGTASNPSITLVKRDSTDLSLCLAGATFQLSYLDASGAQVPVLDRSGQAVTFTTAADGTVLIAGNQQLLGWTLWEDRTYCLEELTAPAGYVLSSGPVYFRLSESPQSQMEYDLTGDRLSVQNDPLTTSVSVAKQWAGPAAASVTVRLLADDVEIAAAQLTADTDWQYTFADLRVYDPIDGHEIIYDVQEDPIENYSSERSGDAETGFTFKNTNTETVAIPVTKQWVGPAGESVVIVLLADGVYTQYVELSDEFGWQYTFENLPKYDSADGHEIVYDVQEDPLENYSSERSGDTATGFTFTNTNTETITIPVTKRWVGASAASVTVRLLADDVEIAAAQLTADTNWQYTFENLPKYDSADGREIVYDVQEDPIENYSSERSGDVSTGFTFTNTNTATVAIPVTKQWVGASAASVTVRLLADGKETASATLTAATQWQRSFSDLPKYDPADGHEIVYTLSEDALTGYTSSITGSAAEGFTVTNTKTPVPSTTPRPTVTPKPATTPKTGDGRSMLFYVVTMLLSGAGLAGFIPGAIHRRRRQ